MRATIRNYLLIGVTAVVFAAAIGWRETALARERVRLREQERREQLKAELEAERSKQLATQVPEGETATREAERVAWVELLSELEAIRRRTEAAVPLPKPNEVVVPARRPTLRDAPLAAHQWRESGTATPEAALETALWASAVGNLERLSGALVLDETVRARAAALFEELPPAMRQEVGSTEQLVAMLTAHAVPLGSAQIVAQSEPQAAQPYVVARLADEAGRSREVQLAMKSAGGQWRIVVPAIAIERFVARGGTR